MIKNKINSYIKNFIGYFYKREVIDEHITEANKNGFTYTQQNPNQRLSDEDFDNLIKEQFTKAPNKNTADDWATLSDSLDTIDQRKSSIYNSKTVEFLAFILIFFTYIQWFNFTYKHIDNDDKPVVAQVINPPKLPTSQGNSSTKVHDFSGNLSQKSIVIESSTPHSEYPRSKPLLAIEMVPKINLNIPSSTKSISPDKSSLTLNTNSTSNLSKNDVPTQIIAINKINSESQNLSAEESSSIHQLPSIDLHPDTEFPYIIPMARSIHPKKTYAISAYGSLDAILINTPFDKVYSKASYNSELRSQSFGINISKTQGTLETETGIGYAKRSYHPEIIRELYGFDDNYYSQKLFDKISFDIISIPVNFKYHFINRPGWSAWLNGGIGTNFVVNAQYGISEIKILGRPAPDYVPQEESRLEEKPFIDGFFNGDNIRDDFFLTVKFGFGINKRISENGSIYMHSGYERHVLSHNIGIGPNKDKLHTASLQMGVKVNL